MRRVLVAVALSALIATAAQQANAQCDIMVVGVGGTTTLCAGGGDEWQWTGPGGFSSTDMCITATMAGTYTLREFDALNGLWSAPCSQVVGTPPAGPSCSIAGPDSVCPGGAAHLCGPTGDFDYAWSGPNGFSAAAACVDVNLAGLYALTLTDHVSGVRGDPCTLMLRAVDCPAPPHRPAGCARSARWWGSGCSERRAPVAPGALAQVAAGVDARSAVLDFGGSARGLCSTLSLAHRSNMMSLAKRQYAAVLANLTSGELGVTDVNGRAIGIDGDRVIQHVGGVPAGMTVSAWVASTEQAMLAMAADSRHERSNRDHCDRIRHQAREIIAEARWATCRSSAQLMADDVDVDTDDDSMIGGVDAAPSSVSGPTTGSPLSGHVSWSLERAGQVELSILDVTGRRVRHVVSGMFSAGTHDFTWDGRDDDGHAVKPGAYFMAGTISGERTSQRLLILH